MRPAAREDAAAALADALARQVARRSLQERRDSDGVAARRAGDLAPLTLEAAAARARAVRDRADADALADRIALVQEEQARLRAELTAAEADLATARRAADEMAEALATISRHLGPHDEDCPVCATRFPPDSLKRLADASARDRDAVLAPIAARVETLRRSLDKATATMAAANESGMHAATAELMARSAEATLATARAEVAALLGVSVDEDLATVADSRLADAANQLSNIEVEIALAVASVAELEAAAAGATRAYAALVAEAARNEESMTANTRRSTELRTSIEGGADDLAAVRARAGSERDALEAARLREAEASAALASALAAEASVRERLDAANAARARVDRTAADARDERLKLAAEWKAAGAPGEPSERGVVDVEGAAAARLALIDGLLAEADRLAASLRELAAASELAELSARMADGARDADFDPLAREQALVANLAGARAALRSTNDAKKAVDAYTVQLKGRADRFSSEFLMPLNGLIDDFNRTLLSTPGETVQFSADAAVNRTDLGMRLRYPDEVDNSRYDTGLAPQLVLSEGQMAANGFSILCAASVAYRWSNWRALLLDDPLQHNDIIHAAAFADVMRNLVEFEAYQLVMSSHDRAEGEFLFRKFDSASSTRRACPAPWSI